MGKSSGVVYTLQFLRLIAASMVVVGHSWHEAVDLGITTVSDLPRPDWFHFGGGVDIFFILSGFVMYLLGRNGFGMPGFSATFLKRRLQRIVPPYWFFTSLTLGAMLIFASRMNHTDIGSAHVVASYLFFPWPDAFGKLQPILGIGWTLNYEMFFYVIFSIALLAPRHIGIPVLVLTFMALTALGQFLDLPGPLKFWCDPIILEFLYGAALAHLYLKGVRWPNAVGAAVVLAGFMMLAYCHSNGWTSGPIRFLGAGLPSLVITAGFALCPEPKRSPLNNLLRFGGDASYVLYLSHIFTINVIGLFWHRLHLEGGGIFIALSFVASVVVAAILHRLIEQPAYDMIRGITPRFPFLRTAERGNS
ncbi:acyltransferase family protein [Geminicoccus flavidas]|uniref:acyltransferase family protein n=1 Tax=Geminicoccus flavidas TaxID=2506407 RepID=UPI0013591FD4|nr:acyltransferase [Geminicoccus flavidas]